MPVWTADQDKLLRECIDEGLSTRAAAERIGVSRNAVVGRAARMGIGLLWAVRPGNVKTKLDRERAIAAQAKGNAVRSAMLARARSKGVLPPLEPPTPKRRLRGIALEELSRDSCRWPFGDAPYKFCGAAIIKFPYCEKHRALAYQPPRRERGK